MPGYKSLSDLYISGRGAGRTAFQYTPSANSQNLLKIDKKNEEENKNEDKKDSKLTTDKVIKGAEHLQSILAGADKLFAEGDMLRGSGHTYSPRQDYSMYIGQGMGY